MEELIPIQECEDEEARLKIAELETSVEELQTQVLALEILVKGILKRISSQHI